MLSLDVWNIVIRDSTQMLVHYNTDHQNFNYFHNLITLATYKLTIRSKFDLYLSKYSKKMFCFGILN